MYQRITGRKPYTSTFILTLSVVFVCAACSPKPYGSHDIGEINDIGRQSGLFYETVIWVEPTDFPPEYSLNINATLSAGIDSPEKVTAAVDYLLRLAWSETNNKPTRGIDSFSVIKPDGSKIDLVAIQNELAHGDKSSEGNSFQSLTHAYGDWPGPVPKVPDDLTYLTDTHCDVTASGPYGTHTCKQIAQQIAQIDPTAFSGGVDIRAATSSLPGKQDIIVDIWGVKKEDLDYLLRLAWAETSVRPTGNIIIFFRGAPHWYEEDPDLPCGKATLVGTGGLSFDYDCLEQLYGPWPGPVPEAPLDVSPTTSPTTEPSPSPSPR